MLEIFTRVSDLEPDAMREISTPKGTTNGIFKNADSHSKAFHNVEILYGFTDRNIFCGHSIRHLL